MLRGYARNSLRGPYPGYPTLPGVPNTETMTALSAWMIACILFVFGALAAYAGILFAKYTITRSKVVNPSTNGDEEVTSHFNENETLKQADKLLLIIFPALFLSFNCAYWPFIYRLCSEVEDLNITGLL